MRSVTQRLAEGVYEHLITEGIERDLAGFQPQIRRAIELLSEADGHLALARHLGQEVARALGSLPQKERLEVGRELVSRLIGDLASLKGIEADGMVDQQIAKPARRLMAIHRGSAPERPATPLAVSTLLTRNRAEPSLGHELAREIAIADRVEAVIAFVTVSGVRAILEALEAFVRRSDRRRMRLLTTVFNGITEVTALDQLGRLPGVEVKVSYDIRRTRLHAKAWLFHRDSGLTTAYVGSANLTSTALGSGQEWMVKLCAADLPPIAPVCACGSSAPGARVARASRRGAGDASRLPGEDRAGRGGRLRGHVWMDGLAASGGSPGRRRGNGRSQPKTWMAHPCGRAISVARVSVGAGGGNGGADSDAQPDRRRSDADA
jgi:HKD family nuclease